MWTTVSRFQKGDPSRATLLVCLDARGHRPLPNRAGCPVVWRRIRAGGPRDRLDGSWSRAWDQRPRSASADLDGPQLRAYGVHTALVGTAGASTPSSRSTIAITDGVRGRAACETVSPGQTDCTENATDPSSEPESGGTTTRSSSVQIETHAGPAGVSSPALSSRSRSLSSASWRQASGQLSGARSAPREARSEPWCGEARVIARRARLPPPSSATQSRTTTPPAEYPTTSTDAAPVRSMALRDSAVERLRLDPQVLGAGRHQRDHLGVAAGAPQGVREYVERGGVPAVPGDQQDRTRAVLGDRIHRLGTGGDDGDHDHDRERDGQHDQGDHEPSPRRRQAGQHRSGRTAEEGDLADRGVVAPGRTRTGLRDLDQPELHRLRGHLGHLDALEVAGAVEVLARRCCRRRRATRPRAPAGCRCTSRAGARPRWRSWHSR